MRFLAPYRAGLAESTKGLQGSVLRAPASPCKFRRNRFLFTGVILEKSDFVRIIKRHY